MESMKDGNLILLKTIVNEQQTARDYNCSIMPQQVAESFPCHNVHIVYTYHATYNLVSLVGYYALQNGTRRSLEKKLINVRMSYSCGTCNFNPPVSGGYVIPINNHNSEQCITVPKLLFYILIAFSVLTALLYITKSLKEIKKMKKQLNTVKMRPKKLNYLGNIIITENGKKRMLRLKKRKVITVAT